MNISFEGKTALVTGASRGIGREIAKQLVKGGAKVIAVARSKDLLESLKKEVPSITTIVCDLSDWDATDQALANIPPVDLLINNAAFVPVKPVIEVEEEEIDQTLAINVKTTIHLLQIVAKGLIERKAPGSIVNISSQASQAGILNHVVYGASKGAVDAFTRGAALEFGPHNIRVNSVIPTIIMTERSRLKWSDPKAAETMLQKIPLGRFGEVKEVVDAVLFLLSDKSSMITGTCLPVDGGFLAC